jgi:hypothetical protein
MRGVFKVLSVDPEIHVARKTSKSYENFQMIEKIIKEDRYQFATATDGSRYGGDVVVYSFSCEPDAIHEGDLISGGIDSKHGSSIHDVYLLAKGSF